MKLAFIGIGNVGFSLANNLQKAGHTIIIAHNDPSSKSVQSALGKNANFQVQSVQSAINEAEVVFLATPFKVNEDILRPLKFNGKTLIDCTNPVGAGISHGLKSEISGAEKVQEWAEDAKVVKSFTIYGFENFANPVFPNSGEKPAMLIAGNDAESKKKVQQINTDLGFFTVDTGDLRQSLHLEHMTLLWVKMVRRDGHHPDFTWAYLER